MADESDRVAARSTISLVTFGDGLFCSLNRRVEPSSFAYPYAILSVALGDRLQNKRRH